MTAPYADGCTRVCTRTGKRSHLLPHGHSPGSKGPALCGIAPGVSDAWLGTGTQAERERAASLPACRMCERDAATRDAAERTLAGLRGKVPRG